MQHRRVDGMDVLAVHEAAKESITAVRESSTPMMLEALTYRFKGHSMGDPERYRTQAEVKKWQDNDPIGRFRKVLLQKKFRASELDAIEQRAEDETRKAVEFAESNPEPGMDELFKDIYVAGQEPA